MNKEQQEGYEAYGYAGPDEDPDTICKYVKGSTQYNDWMYGWETNGDQTGWDKDFHWDN